MTIQVRELKNVTPPLPWEPRVGEQTENFVERKHLRSGVAHPALEGVVHEARQILGRCVNPEGAAKDSTGLVVGYVQSGKTLSFTTLTALAHDNRFGLVVVIAGTKDNLREQTRIRLREDLGIGNAAGPSPWIAVDNPSPGSQEDQVLNKCLRDWINPEIPRWRKRVGLVMVLKHHKRLSNLCDCLGKARMAGVPVLVIDDEADQASPNTFAAANLARGTARRSANYREIIRLKSVLPHHTYVQYTATPQANLLASMQDALSPEFAELLSPGTGYVGGAEFFRPRSSFVRTIPSGDVGATAATCPNPPETLVKALRIFLLGLCALEVKEERAVRSMMVHPSQQTDPHKDYLRWLEDLRDEWTGMCQEPALKGPLQESFREAYEDLGDTAPGLASYEDLIERLPQVLASIMIRDVNSTVTGRSQVDWSASDYWVLVGGAKLDRGFTVEGLTVTYMPRPLGDGSADSIQQRARFCGYKMRYLGFCRIYLESGVRHAFEEYVEHERDIHRTLLKTRGQPLRAWIRQFVLDSSMQPTRKGVIGIPLRNFLASNWIHPDAAQKVPHDAALNRAAFAAFRHAIAAFGGRPAQEVAPARYVDRRRNSPPNRLFEEVPLEVITSILLRQLRYSDVDDQFTLASSILALEKLMQDPEDPQLVASVFAIGDMAPQKRSLRADDKINEVFSGKSPEGVNDRARLNYGGDRDFTDDMQVTLHIRSFTLVPMDGGASEVCDVPWFAIHIPQHLAKRHLIQT